jgi:hypothetical protein
VTRRVPHRVAVAAWIACAACDAKQATTVSGADAGPSTTASAPAPPDTSATPGDTAGASAEANARAAQWRGALTSAMRLPCRAIAVDGAVGVEPEGKAGTDAGLERLAHNAELPEGVWLWLASDARLVAKDPRTTRETTFLGVARVRPCVGRREESWIASGSFESAVGAGETPGAEEWVVTPLAVVRYMAAKLHVDVRAAETTVSIGGGDAFLWLADDVREGRPTPGVDGSSGASTTLDDEGWRRTSDTVGGPLKLVPAAGARSATDAARAVVDRCASLTKRARDLAGALIAGPADLDGGIAKEQVKTRRIARAACALATLRVASLSPSPSKDALSATLNAGSLDR